MAVWSEVMFLSSGDILRLDAEYYKPEYLKYADVISNGDLLELKTKIIHPTEIKRVYEKEGIQILLAQNVRNNYLDFSSVAFMPSSTKAKLDRNKLEYNDVLMTRTGANFGDSAVYKGEPEEIYACADVLIIRPNGVPGGYLSTYFNTKIGRALITRGAYGMAQPHISPSYLYTMRLFRSEDDFEREIDNLVGEAYSRDNESKVLYAEAESLLLRELGLNSTNLSRQIAYVTDFSKAKEVRRLDAEYFHPKYQRTMEIIGSSGNRIKDVAKVAKRRFKPRSGKAFEYIEISDLGADGRVQSKTVMGDEAPIRAKWTVKANDVITSTVRPIRRLSALIETEYEGNICSSGFVVLEPKKGINPELLLIYLRLPIVCEILDLYTTASMYPAISVNDLMNIPISLPDDEDLKEKILNKVKKAFKARNDAKKLREEAKERVEKFILNEVEV